MQASFQTWANETNAKLGDLSEANSETSKLEIAIGLGNHILSLISNEAIKPPQEIIGEHFIELPNAERFDSWFQSHPDFAGPKAAFELLDGLEPKLQAKLYWLKKRSNTLMAGAVHFTPNWEDALSTRNENRKIGIDFFLSPDAKSFHIVLSNYGKLRVLEISERLINTDIEVLEKWHSLEETKNLELLHSTIWDSFKLQSVNAKFYNGVADAFTELHDHLVEIGKPEQEAKMFASRLLGRLIFTWFIRKMNFVSPGSEYFSPSGRDQGDYYRENLESLFFGTLNCPVADRKPMAAGSLDLETPYLNGGLFSPRVDDWVGESTSFPNEYFTRLYEHFSNFNFTTDESTPEYEQVAIDPEMLGRVFESLLASQLEDTGEQARKAKGAFYTPREIVASICKESVRSYLIGQNAIEGPFEKAVNLVLDKSDQEWANDGSNSLRDISPATRAEILDKLRVVKTIDPACGSGAFPLGLLQLLTRIHLRLDPRLDPYKVKLSILQENIFGSDIEPMAVEISRLRSWLSLIIEEANLKTVAPLPNLEFNFVSANSLIHLVEEDLFTNQKVENELGILRRKYFNESSPEGKNEIRQKYQKLSEPDLLDNRSNQLRTFNPFNAEQVAQFFDADVMFGVINGFDIVVGNPPYVDSEMMTKNLPEVREYLRKNYQTTRGNWDLYVPFSERAIQLLRVGGVASFIVKNSLMGSPYTKDLRTFLASFKLEELRDFGGIKVFESASVDTCIFRVVKVGNSGYSTRITKMADNETVDRFEDVSQAELASAENWIPFFLDSRKASLVKRINQHALLGSFGLKANASAIVSEAYKISEFVFDEVDDIPFTYKLVNTGTIDPYITFWGNKETKYIGSKYLHPRVRATDLESMNSVRAHQAKLPKIIVIGMGNVEAFLDNHGEFLAGKTTSIIYSETQGQGIDLRLAVAFLNSSVARFWFRANYLSAGMAGLSPSNLLSLPVPVLSSAEETRLKELVDTAQKVPDQETLAEIENIIVSGYGINPEEALNLG